MASTLFFSVFTSSIVDDRAEDIYLKVLESLPISSFESEIGILSKFPDAIPSALFVRVIIGEVIVLLSRYASMIVIIRATSRDWIITKIIFSVIPLSSFFVSRT